MPPSPTRLWVLDFDNTVLRLHAFALRITVEQVAERSVEEDAADLPFLRAFVAAAQERGDLLAIASFGLRDVISAYCSRLCPGAFQLSTPSAVGVQDGCAVVGGKLPQLEQLLSLLPPASRTRENVYFLDDDPSNVHGAVQVGGFKNSFLVPKGGLTRQFWASEPKLVTALPVSL